MPEKKKHILYVQTSGLILPNVSIRHLYSLRQPRRWIFMRLFISGAGLRWSKKVWPRRKGRNVPTLKKK